MRDAFETATTPIVISGNIGRGAMATCTSLDVGDPAELGEQYAPVMPEPPPVTTTVLPASEG